MSLARLTKVLADLDAKRARVLIAIEETQAADPHAKDAGRVLANKALAHVNGAEASAAGEHAAARRIVTQEVVLDQLRAHGPMTLSAIAKALSMTGGRVQSALRLAAKRTKDHPKLVKQTGRGIGSVWSLVEPRGHGGARRGSGPKPKKGRGGKRAKKAAPGALKAAIVEVLKEHGAPMAFEAIRDRLYAQKVIHNGNGGRSVGVVLANGLRKHGLAKQTREGWIYTGGAEAQ